MYTYLIRLPWEWAYVLGCIVKEHTHTCIQTIRRKAQASRLTTFGNIDGSPLFLRCLFGLSEMTLIPFRQTCHLSEMACTTSCYVYLAQTWPTKSTAAQPIIKHIRTHQLAGDALSPLPFLSKRTSSLPISSSTCGIEGKAFNTIFQRIVVNNRWPVWPDICHRHCVP